MDAAVHRPRTSRTGPCSLRCLCWLVAALLCITAAASAASEEESRSQNCNAAGDDFVEQKQWEAAVTAYRHCSNSHGDRGPIAAWSMYKSYHVLYWHLDNKQAAAAACEAGWEAYNAPELAWCAAFATYTTRTQEAVDWAKKAVAVGCFSGSCQPLAAVQQDPWAMSDRVAKIEVCSWEGPFDVMHWACRALGDAACAAEARRREYQAKYARVAYGKHRQLYQYTKEDVTIPRGPALHDPGQCGKRMLPPRPAPAGHYEPQLHVVTLATDLNRGDLGELLNSAKAHGVRVTILQPRFDLRGYWGGRFGIRLQLVTNFANMVPDEDLVMFVDGYDVIFTGNISSIIDGYYQATRGRDIALFTAETGVWPERDLESAYPPGPTRYRFLNAGSWMGTAHAIRCAMAAINLSFDDHGFLFTDDQWVFANAFIETNKTPHPIIALDYNADVFGSLYDRTQGGFDNFKPFDWECVEGKGYTFKLTGSAPKVIHASGNQGQHWMEREVLPYSLRSGQLGRAAPCGRNATQLKAGQQQQQQQGDGWHGTLEKAVEANKKVAPAPSTTAAEGSEQHRQRVAVHEYRVPPKLYATVQDLKWQLLLAAVGLGVLLGTATTGLFQKRKAVAAIAAAVAAAAATRQQQFRCQSGTPEGLHVA